jgi:glycosyltransferase involved in cell wall biosynthesis
MNILGICLSPGKGGLELYAHKAIGMLQQAGHACHFAVAPNSYLRQREWSMPVQEIKPVFRLFPLFTAIKLARYIDAHQIDILHMHWNKDLNLAALAKRLSRRKPKLVYSRHMEITRSKKDAYHRALYCQVDKMLTIAKFVQEQAVRFLPLTAEQVSLLYLGVQATEPATSQTCSGMLHGIGDSANAFVIGMIGRVEPYKGQHVLIEALTLLKQQHLNLQVAMAGPIMDKAYFEDLNRRIREQGVAGNVSYFGITQEPGKFMSCCDVVVLTTMCETFGLVLVEAMRAGVAVIGTNAGGVPEIIQHQVTGLLFAPGNAQQLADNLAELYRDRSKRDQLALAGKRYADAMFDEKQHFHNLETIFIALDK